MSDVVKEGNDGESYSARNASMALPSLPSSTETVLGD